MLLRPMDTTFVIPIQLSPFAWTGSKIAVICPCCQIALSKPIPLLVNVNVVGPPGFTRSPLNQRGPSEGGDCCLLFLPDKEEKPVWFENSIQGVRDRWVSPLRHGLCTATPFFLDDQIQ